MTQHLFPFADYPWFYAAFTGLVVAFLAFDLGLFHRKAHVLEFREASAWTAVWAALALLFCLGLSYTVMQHGGLMQQQENRSERSFSPDILSSGSRSITCSCSR